MKTNQKLNCLWFCCPFVVVCSVFIYVSGTMLFLFPLRKLVEPCGQNFGGAGLKKAFCQRRRTVKVTKSQNHHQSRWDWKICHSFISFFFKIKPKVNNKTTLFPQYVSKNKIKKKNRLVFFFFNFQICVKIKSGKKTNNKTDNEHFLFHPVLI